MRLLLFLITIFICKVLFAHGTIIIKNVEHNQGYIDVKVYTDKDSFLKEDLAIEAIRKKATKGETIIPLSKIHEGKIAIVVYHDEDSNSELKTGFFGVQKKDLLLVIITHPKVLQDFQKPLLFLFMVSL